MLKPGLLILVQCLALIMNLKKLMILGPHKPTYKIGLLLWSQIVKGPETVMRKHNLGKAATYVCLVSFFVFVLQYLLSTLSSGPVKVHVI